MENLYNSYTNLSQKEKILFREETDERGFARGVLSGITDNQNVYASIAANDDYVYIMEFKLDGSAEEALRQIERKGYAKPYAADARQVIAMGINFSSEKGTIDGFLTQVIP